jgi:hypothetical protein
VEKLALVGQRGAARFHVLFGALDSRRHGRGGALDPGHTRGLEQRLVFGPEARDLHLNKRSEACRDHGGDGPHLRPQLPPRCPLDHQLLADEFAD